LGVCVLGSACGPPVERQVREARSRDGRVAAKAMEVMRGGMGAIAPTTYRVYLVDANADLSHAVRVCQIDNPDSVMLVWASTDSLLILCDEGAAIRKVTEHASIPLREGGSRDVWVAVRRMRIPTGGP